jgi:hypothetical protein
MLVIISTDEGEIMKWFMSGWYLSHEQPPSTEGTLADLRQLVARRLLGEPIPSPVSPERLNRICAAIVALATERDCPTLPHGHRDYLDRGELLTDVRDGFPEAIRDVQDYMRELGWKPSAWLELLTQFVLGEEEPS